jgi:hypothetical protein
MYSETYRHYQEYAEECLRWADEADTDEHRELFLNMAKAWKWAALRMEEVPIPERQGRSLAH